jgi:hypothetical protein
MRFFRRHYRTTFRNRPIDLSSDDVRGWKTADDAFQREFGALEKHASRFGCPQLHWTTIVRNGFDHLNRRQRISTTNIQSTRENIVNQLFLFVFIFRIEKIKIPSRDKRTDQRLSKAERLN